MATHALKHETSTPAFERCRLEFDGAVAILTLDHPEVMNSLSPGMMAGLIAALDHVTAMGTEARCLVVTGAGKAFCTGANLQEARGAIESGDPRRRAGSNLDTVHHPLVRRFRDLQVPIVAAVNGPAAGAGMSIALLADLIVCARSAYFLQAFRRIGLVPDCGSSWLLPRLVGRARAMELSLLGEKLPAETALAWGMVNRVVDDGAVMETALGLARNLAEGPTRALSMISRMYWESSENSFEEQIELERQSQLEAGLTADATEGIKAFLEKRPARFTGR